MITCPQFKDLPVVVRGEIYRLIPRPFTRSSPRLEKAEDAEGLRAFRLNVRQPIQPTLTLTARREDCCWIAHQLPSRDLHSPAPQA